MTADNKPCPYCHAPTGSCTTSAQAVFCTPERRTVKADEGMEPLGADFEAVWDANVDKVYQYEGG